MEYHDIVCLKCSSRRKGFPEFSNEILPRLAPFVVECSTLAVTEDFLSALSFYKEPWYTSSLVINRELESTSASSENWELKQPRWLRHIIKCRSKINICAALLPLSAIMVIIFWLPYPIRHNTTNSMTSHLLLLRGYLGMRHKPVYFVCHIHKIASSPPI